MRNFHSKTELLLCGSSDFEWLGETLDRGETPALMSGDLFAGFHATAAFVATHVDGRNGIPVSLSLDHVLVPKSWCLHQRDVDFFPLATFLTTKYVIPGKIRIRVGRPKQINERGLAGSGKDSLEAAGHGGSIDIAGKNPLCG